MRIGQLADAAGVTADTIRYYERIGLLAPPQRGPNRYRDYGPAAEEDLRFIRKARSLGLRLEDIRTVLDISSRGQAPCEHLRTAVAEQLSQVDAKLRELRSVRTVLRATLEQLDRTPRPDAGCRCAVIESA